MRFTQKLLAALPRYFDRAPYPFSAFRLRFDGPGQGSGPFGSRWSVADGVLTATRTAAGFPDHVLSVNLIDFTIAELAQHLAADGFHVVLEADPERATTSALALMDGAGDQATSDGDRLLGYTALLWAYMESIAAELDLAQQSITEAAKQLATVTATGEWLDLLGSYYFVPRLAGEGEADYATRIIAEVLRPRGNNIALEIAITEATGLDVTVNDVTVYGDPVPNYGGAYVHDGSEVHNATARPIYGLFDVELGYDLLSGGSPAGFIMQVRGLVNRLRDAGTYLRSVLLSGSILTDAGPALPDDAFGVFALGQILADTGILPGDAALAIIQSLVLDADTLPPPGAETMALAQILTLTDAGPMPGDSALVALTSALTLAAMTDTGPMPTDGTPTFAGLMALTDAGPALTDPTPLDSLEITMGARTLDGSRTLDGTWYLAAGTTATIHLDGST